MGFESALYLAGDIAGLSSIVNSACTKILLHFRQLSCFMAFFMVEFVDGRSELTDSVCMPIDQLLVLACFAGCDLLCPDDLL